MVRDLAATSSSTEQITVTDEETGQRLDRVLASRVPALSRSRLKALILAGEITVGGRTVVDPSLRVNSGDLVAVTVPEPEPAEPQAENIPLNIVYEDGDIVVIDKPKNLVVHPAAGHWTGTLVNALIAHCGDSLSGIGGVRRPGIVHRLDKDTTGLMVIAKNDAAHQSLAAQFADHGREGPLRRGYLAFVWGAPDRPRGTIDAPLDRDPRNRERRAVRASGREAITHWERLEVFSGADGKPIASLLACQLETGRTHQIRAHFAHIGLPLMGDTLYAGGFRTKAARLSEDAQNALRDLGRQALHAYLLTIAHPSTSEILEFRSDLPGDLRRLHSSLTSGARLDVTKKETKTKR